jgi:HK97 family phage major capsid protein
MKNEMQIRAATIEAQGEGDEQQIRMSVSSESPVLSSVYMDGKRIMAYEILDHNEGSIDMSRCKEGLVVLDRHDGDQIGLMRVEIVDGKLSGPVEFCSGSRAQEIKQDAEKGLRRNVSVGYQVKPSAYVLEGERDGIPVVRATSWMPYEASFEPVPADIAVGVNRSEEKTTAEPTAKTQTRRIKMSDEKRMLDADGVVEVYRLARAFDMQPGDADDHIKSGGTVEDFRARALKKAEADKVEMQRKLEDASKRKPEVPENQTRVNKVEFDESQKREIAKRYSLMNVVRAKAGIKADVGFEQELSDEIGKQTGRQAQGFYIPHNAPVLLGRADPFLKTSNGSAFVATNLLTGQFIDALRSQMVLSDAGATILSGLSGDIAIPKGGTITGNWVDGENGAGTEGKPTVGQVTGTPKTASGWTDISRRMLIQSSVDVEMFVQNELVNTIARLIEVAAFAGTNANGQPKGLISQTGVNNPSVTANAATRAQMINFLRDIMADNADFPNQSWITRPEVMASLANRLESVAIRNEAGSENVGGGPVPGYLLDINTRTMLGSPVRTTTNVPAHHLFFGAWSQLIIGLWSGVDITVDPYSNSTTGALRIVSLQDADVMVRHGEAFAFNAAVTA